MDKPLVALTNIYTGNIVYCTNEWLFHKSEVGSMPCKSIEYVDMSLCGLESFYRVVFKANQYTYVEDLPVSHFTAVRMFDKEGDL